MRLSLLLKREPFGEILEKTMSGYWNLHRAEPLQVHWGKGDGIVWRGNIYLNFFCIDGVNPECFEVIKREFSHSRSAWRRGLQAAYVQAATRPPFRNWMSQVRFCVSREVPDAREQLLIGGNRRLRIIHPSAGRSIVIHKTGFDRRGFERELVARKGIAARVAPQLYEEEPDGAAFSEEYFVGTPANRFAPHIEKKIREEAQDRLISEVHRPTLRETLLSEYIIRLAEEVSARVPTFEQASRKIAEWVLKFAGKGSIGLVFSHGDFQDANILVQENELRIIDWENATERSQLYDLATMASGIRMSRDSLQVWERTTENWMNQPASLPHLEIQPDGKYSLLSHAAVWWLEETLFRIDELESSSALVDDVIEKHKIGDNLAGVSRFLNAISK